MKDYCMCVLERKINEKCKCSIGSRKKEKEDVEEDQMMLLEQKKTIKMPAMKENNSCLRTFFIQQIIFKALISSRLEFFCSDIFFSVGLFNQQPKTAFLKARFDFYFTSVSGRSS